MSWRSKFVLLLIVYFAGFASAIYCLAPAPEGKTGNKHQANKVFAGVKSADVARSVNSGVHKCVDFGKDGRGPGTSEEMSGGDSHLAEGGSN